jgi:hypothetical protein
LLDPPPGPVHDPGPDRHDVERVCDRGGVGQMGSKGGPERFVESVTVT